MKMERIEGSSVRGWVGGLFKGVLLGAGLVAALAASSAAVAQSQAAQARLEELIKAAKAEGELTYYTVQTDNVMQPFDKAFTAKYGIKTTWLRIPQTTMFQRYFAEFETGNTAADLSMANNADSIVEPAFKKGWLQNLREARLPAVMNGEFPSKFLRDYGAIVQISPWHILYNTQKLKGDDIPKTWTDLLNPKYKGQIAISDLSESDSLIAPWQVLQDAYGEKFFAGLRAQGLRVHSNTIIGVQGMGAGESSIWLPAARFVATLISAKGAPVDGILPEGPGTGIETLVFLNHPSKSKRPNAARLFVNFMLSQEGNTAFAQGAGAGTYSVFDTKGLPRAYASPKPLTNAEATRTELQKLLGVK